MGQINKKVNLKETELFFSEKEPMLGCFEKRNEIPDSKSGKEFLYD
jgi:hypothetical protein